MATKLRNDGVTSIVLLTPPPCDDSHFPDGSRSNARVKLYAAAAVEAAKDLGLPFINLHEEMQASGGRSWGHGVDAVSSGAHTLGWRRLIAPTRTVCTPHECFTPLLTFSLPITGSTGCNARPSHQLNSG